jgi:inorganic pyrophosphatase
MLKQIQGSSNNSIFFILATRWPLFYKGRSWPKPIFRGALNRIVVTLLIVALLLAGTTVFADPPDPVAEGARYFDTMTIAGDRNFLHGIPPVKPDGRVNVVVEIPAGTDEKWEVTKSEGLLQWQIENGRPRVVQYLPYPGNYGMVPRTLLPKEAGGDGDPLDILILGRAKRRGTVMPVKLIGVLKLLDNGEQDDKLLAVPAIGPLSQVKNLKELDASHPGITQIIETWFTNYKGLGKTKSLGFANPESAQQILVTAIIAYQKSKKK